MLDKYWEYNIECIDLRQANDSVRFKKIVIIIIINEV